VIIVTWVRTLKKIILKIRAAKWLTHQMKVFRVNLEI